MNTSSVLAIAVASLTITAGCATKRYVRESMSPIDKKTAELDRRTAENTGAIQSLEEKTQRNLARVDEKAGAADARAAEATRLAQQAGAQATDATQKADAARGVAEGGVARVGELERMVGNLDDYKVTSSTTVYFDFNKILLSDQARQELDALAKSAGGSKRFFVSVQGYADTIGAADYNYALSEKRAAAVVRYLTTQHNIPVYRIHTIGFGMDNPASTEKGVAARKQNRRVEIRVYTADASQTATRASSDAIPPRATP